MNQKILFYIYASPADTAAVYSNASTPLGSGVSKFFINDKLIAHGPKNVPDYIILDICFFDNFIS